ncbi:LysM repeat protein [Enterococcus sp. PF1-24]|uniref:LysM peptidoglycan-binding domain-containing protein n=1 Tax=unclassified Enterococcus TaxID=2608891 RepID=UPI0024735085|nr:MULTISPECIES: LysM peptidoglycan-binding domain-containing protein [unclassified Enterococcus]MDH6364145.1 LysM repeat protein [Enterococcus sp. PFB1-1]MDH6401246.1 LysM repeat protein [Enterococcus sp. PF1-24]
MKKTKYIYLIVIVIALGLVAFTSFESLVQVCKLKNTNAQLSQTLTSYEEKIANLERSASNHQEQITSKDQQIKTLEKKLDDLYTGGSTNGSSTTPGATNTNETTDSSTDGDAVYDTVSEAYPTLYSIANKNGISLETLLQLNGLSSDSLIVMGQQLRVK